MNEICKNAISMVLAVVTMSGKLPKTETDRTNDDKLPDYWGGDSPNSHFFAIISLCLNFLKHKRIAKNSMCYTEGGFWIQ